VCAILVVFRAVSVTVYWFFVMGASEKIQEQMRCLIRTSETVKRASIVKSGCGYAVLRPRKVDVMALWTSTISGITRSPAWPLSGFSLVQQSAAFATVVCKSWIWLVYALKVPFHAEKLDAHFSVNISDVIKKRGSV